MTLTETLKTLNACGDAVLYSENKTAIEAWEACERGDWMLWIAKKRGVDIRIITKAKVRCVRTVEHLMKDPRSISALNAADRFANGGISREKLGAYAADATAYAAAAYADAAADAYAYAAAYAAGAAAYAAGAYAAAAGADAGGAAAYAGGAAAYAAAGAGAGAGAGADAYAYAASNARIATLKVCADICRETIPFELLNL